MERASLRQAWREIKLGIHDTYHHTDHWPKGEGFGRSFGATWLHQMLSTWMTRGNLFLNLFLRCVVGFFQWWHNWFSADMIAQPCIIGSCSKCFVGCAKWEWRLLGNIYAPHGLSGPQDVLVGWHVLWISTRLNRQRTPRPITTFVGCEGGFVCSVLVRYASLPSLVPSNHMSLFIVLNRDVDVFLSLGKCWYAIHG